MSWHYWLLIALAVWWLHFAVVGGYRLYVGYGFAMAALLDEQRKLSPPYIAKTDRMLALPIVLRDAFYNGLVMPILCLDPRPSYTFRRVRVGAVSFWFFDVVTERLSRYNEDENEWSYRRWVARTVAPFLDAKDPKGWHIRKATND